jgi:aspartate/methionine/tyrosine aminotransferase
LENRPQLNTETLDNLRCDGEEEIASLLSKIQAGYEITAERLNTFSRVEFIEPDGAFYCFFRVDGLTDSFAAAGEILEQTKAGLAPGVAFGPREKVICNGHTNEIVLMGEFLIGGCT